MKIKELQIIQSRIFKVVSKYSESLFMRSKDYSVLKLSATFINPHL